MGFAALKEDGSVVTWGDYNYDIIPSNTVSELSSEVSTIFSNDYSFAALKEDGSVVSWGNDYRGGRNLLYNNGRFTNVDTELSNDVSSIYSTKRAFAALKEYDTDSDGVSDNFGAFPNDPYETKDTIVTA